MRDIIRNRDLKTLFGGVSIAAAAGLLLGTVMYPDLNEGEVKGPQMLMAGGGARGEVTVADIGVPAYRGKVPDYVIGTDATRPAPEIQVMAYNDRAEREDSEVMAYQEPPQITPARWKDEPRPAPNYPSQHGNVAHEIDLPAPPPPPSAADEEPTAG